MNSYYKKNNKDNRLDNTNDIELHIIEWLANDEKLNNNDNDSDSDESEDSVCNFCGKNFGTEKYNCKCIHDEYVIRCFGLSKIGESDRKSVV